MTVIVPAGSDTASEAAAEAAPVTAGRARLDRALAALRAAEQRTGVAPAGGAAPARRPVVSETPAVATRPARSVPASRGAVPGRVPGRAPGGTAEARTAGGGSWPVHPDLAALLPGGVLPAGGTVAVLGSTALLLALLATASRAGAWVAFVGAPAVGMLAAADAGVELERVALVPAPGPDAPAAVAALLDGMDLVVVGPEAPLLDGDRRRLAARARERGAVLVATEVWPGAHVRLDARGGSWSGADRGSGWLRRRTLRVLRTGRGAAARPVEIDVEVPLRATVVVPGLPAGLPATGGAGTAAEPAAAVPAPAVPDPAPLRVVA